MSTLLDRLLADSLDFDAYNVEWTIKSAPVIETIRRSLAVTKIVENEIYPELRDCILARADELLGEKK